MRTITIKPNVFRVVYNHGGITQTPWEKCQCDCESGCDVCDGTRVVYRSTLKLIERDPGFPKLNTTWIDTPDGTFDVTGREIV